MWAVCWGGICFPSYIHAGGSPPPHPTHPQTRTHTHTSTNTHTRACHLCHLWCVCVCVCACSPRRGRLSAPPGFPDCVPVCLPALRFVYVCLYFYLSVCLLCEVRATRAFLIASSLLRHQNTVKQSTATVESVWREETEEGDQWSSFPSEDALFFKILVPVWGGHAARQ